MRPLLWQVFFAFVSWCPANAARVALSARLRGQAHILQTRLSHLEDAVRRGSRHYAGKHQHRAHQQWEWAEDEMLRLRRQIASTEKDAQQVLENDEELASTENDPQQVNQIHAPPVENFEIQRNGKAPVQEMVPVQDMAEGVATKGELNAVEAKLAGQQEQLDRLESIVDRLVSNAPSKPQNISEAGPLTAAVKTVSPDTADKMATPSDEEAASQQAAENLANEMQRTQQGHDVLGEGVLTEDEVQQEDKEYHTPAPHVAESPNMADDVQAIEQKAPVPVEPVQFSDRNEDTWQDFEDPGEDPEEAFDPEEEPAASSAPLPPAAPAVPLKDVLNMANGNLQRLAPAEIRDLKVPKRNSKSPIELPKDEIDDNSDADSLAEDEDENEDAEESSSELPGLVPLKKVEEETAQVEGQDNNDAIEPGFDEEEDAEPAAKEIPLASPKKSINAGDGSLDSAEQLLREDGSAEALTPDAIVHSFADSSKDIPGAVTYLTSMNRQNMREETRPTAHGPPSPLFFGPPPKGMPAFAPA